MCIKGLTVIFSSHKGKDYDEMFKERIKSTCGVPGVKVICIENHNQYSLTQAYNIGWDKFIESGCDDIVVFCHNDIHFKTPKWGVVLLNTFRNYRYYSVLGLAGTIELADNGVWWNDRTKCFGIVDHTDGFREWTTHFSHEIKGVKDVAAIDGVFIAINPDNTIIDFNEEFKGFHFYDIVFSAENFIDGNRIGVITNIRIMHESVGITNQQWEDNRKQFVEMFKDKLPLRVLQQ